MPSTSKKQHNLMAAVAKNPAFAKKVGIKQSVGEEFLKADKGRKFGLGGGVGITKGGKGQINKQGTRAGSIFGEQKEVPNVNLNKYTGKKEGGKVMATKKVKKMAFGGAAGPAGPGGMGGGMGGGMRGPGDMGGGRGSFGGSNRFTSAPTMGAPNMGGMGGMGGAGAAPAGAGAGFNPAAANAAMQNLQNNIGGFVGFKKGGKIMDKESKSESKKEMKADIKQDKAIVKKAFKMHDAQEHKGGKGTNLSKLKKGGMAMKETMGPRTMSMDVEKGSNKLTKFGESAVQKRGKTKGKNLGDKQMATVGPKTMKMAKGGSASSRADGIAQKGKTRGTMMCMGGSAKGKK